MVLEGIFKKKEERQAPAPEPRLSELSDENAELTLRSEFYRKIIEKYAAMINEYEEKTVPELKSLINRSDQTIQELRGKFTTDLLEDKMRRGGTSADYVYSTDFLFIADKIFRHCQGLRHIHANLAVSFWLSMKEVEELGAADPFDRAILLCTLLRAFEGDAKIRVLEMENNLIHPVIMMGFEGRKFVLDASQQAALLTSFSGADTEEVLKSFNYDGNKYIKSAYEFNDDEYSEF